jgi:hypothetical protein
MFRSVMMGPLREAPARFDSRSIAVHRPLRDGLNRCAVVVERCGRAALGGKPCGALRQFEPREYRVVHW